jgi:hypothetical protein
MAVSKTTKMRVTQGGLALLFVVITLVGWWLFASLAETVVNCVPWRWGGSCVSPFTERPRLQTGVRISMLIVSLFAAIWVANRFCFTPPKYEPNPDGAPAVNP